MVMHTFEATFRSSVFWLAVVIPPTVYWGVVQMFAFQAGDGLMPVAHFMTLIALANGLPLAALLWMLFSVAAYTIAPGKVIEHRVVQDREFTVGPGAEVVRLSNGEIAVRLPERTLRLRVADPDRCLASLRAAQAAVRSPFRL